MTREVKLLRDEWMFYRGDVPGAEMPGYNDEQWVLIDIPHDWSVEGPYIKESWEYWHQLQNIGHRIGYLPQGIAWYRKDFTTSPADKDKHFTLVFDGVYRNADVWINGHHLGFHPYGYSPFYFDITRHLNNGGKNVISVRVDNTGISSRWYAGSGIYRDVHLVITDPIHVATWGTYVTTPEVSDDNAKMHVRTRVVNGRQAPSNIELVTSVFDGSTCIASTSEERIIPQGEAVFNNIITIKNPHRWDVDDPHLYQVKSVIKVSGSIVDENITSVGIRTIKFEPNTGFWLNGKNIKVKGVCLHHDNGCIGAVEHVKAVERKLRVLRDMGCNAIRTSHNPPSEIFLDCCDKAGFLVMDEAFDEWKMNKTPRGYGEHYDAWHETDMENYVLRDRNHPSIILWSIGNEIPEQKYKHGADMCKHLVDIFHRLDPTRPVTSGSNNPAEANATGYSDHLDVVGYNYYGDHITRSSDRGSRCRYDDEHDKYPNRCMIGSENVSSWATRGFYTFPGGMDPYAQAWKLGPHKQCSAYDYRSEITLYMLKTRPYVSGCFTWEGWDYIGEPSPYDWPARSSTFGIVDLAGFPKDVYYLYKSQWTDPKKSPMVHLVPQRWNWEPGTTIPVWVYSNCEAVELFLNGKSLGIEKMATWEGDELLHAEYAVPWAPGELKAVAMQGGKVVATDVVRTAGAPSRLDIQADHDNLVADNHDITFITVRVLDASGNVVPTAQDLVLFSVDGPGTIVGVDNGCATSHEPFKDDQVHAFSGMCLAVVKSLDRKGIITVVATSPELKPVSVRITVG